MFLFVVVLIVGVHWIAVGRDVDVGFGFVICC